MPEAGDTGWYSDWWNDGQGGAPAWETFHLRELRPLLEQGYGAGQRRVVAGLSHGRTRIAAVCRPQPGHVPRRRVLLGHGRSPSRRAASGGAGPHDALRLRPEAGSGATRSSSARSWQQHDPLHPPSSCASSRSTARAATARPARRRPPAPGSTPCERDFLHQNLEVAAAIEAVGGDVTPTSTVLGRTAGATGSVELHDSLTDAARPR